MNNLAILAKKRLRFCKRWSPRVGWTSGGLVIGLAQCGLIFYGLRLMSQGSAERTAQLTAQHDETMTAMKTQREESMTALTELIRRTAPRP